MRSPALDGLTPALKEILKQVGGNIALARKNRRMTQQDLAERARISIPTLRQVERGDPAVAMGILLRILFILRLQEGFSKLADPALDEIGLYEARRRQPKRVRQVASLADSF